MSDLDIIKQIEEKYNIQFKKVEKVSLVNPGAEYSINSLNQVIGLKLYDTNLKDYSFLKDLVNLKTLDLDDNKISDISFLKGLINLKTLYLNDNQIFDISSLKDLVNLNSLNLSNNKISDISFLKDLVNLNSLGLSNNKISDYSFLKDLVNLNSLDLKYNQISDYHFLKDLVNLNSLDLRYNQISDISFLKDLVNLNSLNLGNNQISDIYFLKDLVNLNSLYLEFNQISDIYFLKGLVNLNSLDLSYNKIPNISFLKGLVNLNSLDLSYNQISVLPKWITNYKTEIEWEEYGYDNINLYNNPIENLPIDIIKQGKEAVINYFTQLEKDTASYLYETKLLIIGEGGTGKTSFTVKMINKDAELPKDDTTLGVEVSKWNFDINTKRGKQTFYANLWDFGGQKLYQGTHQIFFNTKSLYILLDDAREQKTDFGYWINTVEQLAGKESKILIVTNKKHAHIPQIDENGLTSRFGDLIEGFVSLDLKNDIKKIGALQNRIKKILPKLPNIGDKLPASWVKIREELFSVEENFISQDRYVKICKKHQLSGKDKLDYLSEYFNRIGVISHYYDNPILKNRIYLNSNWLLKTVYEVLNHEIVKKEANKGIISKEELKKIWKNVYTEIDNLSELMKRFGLMYEINNKYVIPAHLPNEQPYKIWKYEDKLELLQFAYEFDKYMPKGILPRLIVALNERIYNQNLVWNKGFNIEFENTFAEIKETYDINNKFLIRIYGNRKKELLGIINYEFDKLLKNFKTQPEKLVPCICDECKVDKNPYFYKYSLLEKYKNNNIELIRCEKSIKETNVFLLLDGIRLGERIGFKRILEEIMTNRKESYKNTNKIILNIDNRFDELVALSNSNKEDIINLVGKLNANQTEELATKFMQVNEELLKNYKGKDLVKYKTYLQETKNSSNWETKLKLSVPLINLLGIDISTEVKFNLVKWIKTNYKKYEDDIYDIMGVTNTKQFRE